jgi:hypothetical protein
MMSFSYKLNMISCSKSKAKNIFFNTSILLILLSSIITNFLSSEKRVEYIAIGSILFFIAYFYIIYIIIDKKLIIKFNGLFLILLTYIIILTLLSLIRGQFSIIFFMFSSIILLIYLHQFFFNANEQKIDNRTKMVLNAVLIISLTFIGFSFYFLCKYKEGYLTTIFLNRNTFSLILLWGFWAITLLGIYYPQRIIYKIFKVILFFSIMATGSRASILGLIIFWTFPKMKIRIPIVLFIGCLLIFIAGSQLKDYYRIEKGLSHREYLWKASVDIWKKSPIIGHGYNSNIKLLSKNPIIRNFADELLRGKSPHNTYIRYLVDFGLIGLLVYLSVWILVLKQLWENRENIISRTNMGFIFAIMAHHFFETGFLFGLSFNNIMLLIFIYVATVLNNKISKDKIYLRSR